MSSIPNPPMSDLSQVTSGGTDSSAGSVQIGDFEFCANHGRETCADCGVDCVEDNDFAAGIEHVEGREPIEFAFSHNKNGDVVCKKHNSTKDGCFAFKKQIVKLNKDAEKAAKKNGKNKNSGSNLFA
ncbi:hypothetical protein P389DRAFT_172710 [Cystobasidium minutum MCA 4210]|uniref:uncharacterized protein n=1 Tax=Cystobasidium minutum MCA 4210 TaxID=1397322 RepID=UPI0034CF3F80|eukprot:jgi/Rhomi1/172710/fgenesh1_kg.5_\